MIVCLLHTQLAFDVKSSLTGSTSGGECLYYSYRTNCAIMPSGKLRVRQQRHNKTANCF